MSVLTKLTTQILDHILLEVKKDENKNRIQKVLIDPIIDYSVGKIYPYMLFTAGVFVLTFLIAIIILIILLRK